MPQQWQTEIPFLYFTKTWKEKTLFCNNSLQDFTFFVWWLVSRKIWINKNALLKHSKIVSWGRQKNDITNTTWSLIQIPLYTINKNNDYKIRILWHYKKIKVWCQKINTRDSKENFKPPHFHYCYKSFLRLFVYIFIYKIIYKIVT